MAFTETDTTGDYENVSPEQLRLFYATKASINPNLSTPSIPPTVSQVHADTVARQGSLAIMAVSDYQGMLQNFFVGLLGAKRILEVGTFTGASAIFFASALQRNGVSGGPDAHGNKPLTCLEISEEYAAIARQNFVQAGVDDYIDIVVGDAHHSLAELADQTFDLIFLDADKPSYTAYCQVILNHHMLAPSGLIIADNTAFNNVTPFINIPAPVASDATPLDVPFSGFPEEREHGQAIHEFNEYIRQEPSVEAVMLPLFTGITLVRLLPSD
ncbi:hypothetical protein IWW52_002395 [Coemansia sp. RSA 2704]|nr:hypothetical protein IWW54_003947 [Coemansia sp. RSA 2705]KAJ2318717.1 hypothetical protein IWW52_002395 [Coemansia sp. RSA 2704]